MYTQVSRGNVFTCTSVRTAILKNLKRRDRLDLRARKSSSPDIKSHYKRFRAHVQKVIRDVYWKHISSIFSFDTDSADPDCPRKNEKAKKFWSLYHILTHTNDLGLRT